MTHPSPFALAAYVNDVLWRLADDYGIRPGTCAPRAMAYARAQIGQAHATGLDAATAAFVTACDVQAGKWRNGPLPGCKLAA